MLLLIYDIPNDRLRARIADACLDYGLSRIQYSAFVGKLSRTHREELHIKLRRILGRQPGVIQTFSFCQDCWHGRAILGKPLLVSATNVED